MSDSLIIMGPTAVGKSDIAVEVARRTGGEIISADSMQIYRGLDIGTAKSSAETLASIPHHMIDIADPSEDYSVAKYRRAAGEAIEAVLNRGRVPIVAGGTGLYIHSLLYDMDFGGTKGDASVRAKYEQLARERGKSYVHGLLADADEEAARLIHPNNLARVIRALERVSAGGGGEEHTASYKPFGFGFRSGGVIDPALFLLTRERADLVKRIDGRVDEMILSGLEDEARRLMDLDLPPGRVAALSIGYKEMIGYLRGEYGADEAAELIKIHTRQYAKRQMTWMRRYEDARVIDLTITPQTEAVGEIVRAVNESSPKR
jgi:tRNA dimethylallyltransferase